MKRCFSWALAASIVGPAAGAQAFCGFYVAGADADLHNDATMVVMMREGTTTVLSMQNNYEGPPADFAMVVPVPVVLHEEDVRTLPREVFERVDRLAAPRLVEYWEQDPCAPPQSPIGLGSLGTIGRGGGGAGYGRGAGAQVVVEAEFTVGEYDIVILSASDSGALDTWLRDNGYRIPDGAEEVLRPYVASGMKFFVAKVDPTKVEFDDGRAMLSPLRVHYPSETFELPVRLGLLSSAGTQDLVVHVLARNQRYEVANYPNVTIPTNIDVADEVRTRFAETYAALFDRTLERNPGAVVTEYAWQATNCDPCPGPVLTHSDLMTLGADVALGEGAASTMAEIRPGRPSLSGGRLAPEVVTRIVRRHLNEVRFCVEMRTPPTDVAGRLTMEFSIDADGTVKTPRVAEGSIDHPGVRSCVSGALRRWRFPAPEGGRATQVSFPLTIRLVPGQPGFGRSSSPLMSFVLTRLHYRYGRDGLDEDLVFREAGPIVGGREHVVDGEGNLEEGAREAGVNNFQARYAIRHAWTGAVECESPRRGVWGGPPGGQEPPETSAATDLAGAPRGAIDLPAMLAQAVPELGITGVGAGQPPPTPAPPAEEAPPAARSSGGGCGCASTSPRHEGAALAFACVAAWCLRRRRR